MMKLNVQFGEETRFYLPNLQITRTRVQPSPGIQVSLRAFAVAGRQKPIELELKSRIFPEDLSP